MLPYIRQITAATIHEESYYNLCRLSELTGYRYPDRAIAGLNLMLWVKCDNFGNIQAIREMREVPS